MDIPIWVAGVALVLALLLWAFGKKKKPASSAETVGAQGAGSAAPLTLAPPIASAGAVSWSDALLKADTAWARKHRNKNSGGGDCGGCD